MKPNPFDIPPIYYFTCGNPFTGSKKDLNYRIDPQQEMLHAAVWHGFISSELATPEQERDFPMNEEGHAALLQWLGEM